MAGRRRRSLAELPQEIIGLQRFSTLGPRLRSRLEKETASRGSPSMDAVCSARSELHHKVHEDQPAKRVIRAREGVAIPEDARVRGAGADDRRILIEDVVDTGAQREGLVDGPHCPYVEIIPGPERFIGRESASDDAQ